MASAGACSETLPVKWPVHDAFVVLGHVLQSDGSIRECWRKTRRAMWRAFWANPGSKNARPLDTTKRLMLLDKAVAPQLDYRCSRWPPQRAVAHELDGVHRKMVASLMRVPRYPCEDVGDFVRRRGRVAAHHCRSSGRWSKRWFKRASDWNQHLERPRNRCSWSAKLLHYMDREWFIQRRISLLPTDTGSQSSLAGRTNARARRGPVHARWHDGIELAKEWA